MFLPQNIILFLIKCLINYQLILINVRFTNIICTLHQTNIFIEYAIKKLRKHDTI
jgi:hypothetical protein